MNRYVKDHQEDYLGAITSAEVIAPLIVDLIHPQSIIDVGCGVGGWLSVFKKLGVNSILGIDGQYVEDILQIPRENFLPMDLRNPGPMNDKYFDLVISLEVAEHLPEKYSDQFVGFLTKLGPVVLFSAAIPFQPGTDHCNLQWPGYWASLFQNKGYSAIDCIRMKVWDNNKVDWWYSQNIVLYVKNEAHKKYFNDEVCTNFQQYYPKSIVHPSLYLMQCENIVSESKYLFFGIGLSWLKKTLINLLKTVLQKQQKC
jgi:SAM-dependent methyltransferase